MVFEIDFLNQLVNFLIYLHSVLDNQHHVLLKIHLLFSPTPVITRSNIYISQTRTDRNQLKLSFYPTTFTSIDQVCCICQESWTFFCLRKKTKLSAFISIRGQVFSASQYITFFFFFFSLSFFICSYAADVKRSFCNF